MKAALPLVPFLWFALGGTAAADRSGVRPEVLAIPTGPGSIEGLGESFDPSPQTGAASYAVAIDVAPGVGGFEPDLSLDYSTGAGSGDLGLGWSLSLPSVQRSTDEGLPRYDAGDTFILRGLGGVTEDLVPLADGTYRYRIEGGFVRARPIDANTWEVHNRSGVRFVFGGDAATVRDGARVFAWRLVLQEDPLGNRIAYEYERDTTGRPYLVRIVYGDFGPEVRNEVLFVYEERPDPLTSYLATFPVTTARRLSAIETRAGGALVSRYELGYEMLEGLSRLASVRLVGADGVTALPALTFAYAEPAMGAASVVTMTAAPARSVGTTAELDDVNGDGLADLLVTDPALDGGAYSFYENLDGSGFASRTVLASSPSVWLTSGNGVELADMDGDGAADVVARLSTASDGFRFYSSQPDGFAEIGTVVSPNPVFAPGDPNVRLVDLDHDRRTDWLRIDPSTGGIVVAFNQGGGAFTAPVTLPRLDPAELLTFTSGTPLQLADMNGDGLIDLVALRSGSLRYWPAKGRGSFNAAVSVGGAPVLSDAELSAAQIRDVTGDGLADVIHVGVSQARIWTSLAGRTLAAPRTISGTPALGASAEVRFADMNGNGSADIVWIDPTNGAAAWRYLDLLGDGGPGLLKRIDNGLGAITTIDYEGMGAMRARARAAGLAWTRRSPIGQMVVATMTADDGLGNAVAIDLFYADGYYDGPAREFRGFALALRRDRGDAEQPTLETEMLYDVGDQVEARKGLLLSVTRRDATGRVFDIVTSVYEVRAVAMSAANQALLVAYKLSETTAIFEGEAAARFLRTDWDYDDDGNVTREAQLGEVSVMGDGSVGDDESITEWTYAKNRTTWVLDAEAREVTTNLQNLRLSETRSYYDGEPLVGLPLGEVERGLLTREETWIEGDRFVVDEVLRRDAFGNVIERIDGRGGRTEIDYDDESHSLVTAVRVFPESDRALAWQADYDRRLGLMTRVVGPSGAEQRFGYDTLGRLVWTVEPGDTEDLPTERHEYVLGAPLSYVRSEARERSGEPGTMVSFAYVDGRGRARGQLAESDGGQWVASGLVEYGARGFERLEGHPFFAASADWLPGSAAPRGLRRFYDALGRPVREVEPDGAESRFEYLPFASLTFDENDTDPSSAHTGTPTTEIFDGLGRVRAVVRLDGQREVVSSFDYDAEGRLVAATDPLGRVRRYGWDGRDRQRWVEDPNAGRWEFTYDDDDALLLRVDAAGNRVRYAVDLAGRAIEEWQQAAGEPSERRTVAMHYDIPSPYAPELGTNVAGQLSWVEDEAGEIHFGYDARGRLTDRVRRWDGGGEHFTWTDFDAADRPTRRGYPDGSYLPFEYDARGLVRRAGGLATELRWTPAADLDRATFGNGVVDNRTYDDRLRAKRLDARAQGSPLRDLTLVYDGASQVIGLVDGRQGGGDPAFDLSSEFVYDDLYRLVTATDRVASSTWRYDDTAKILSVSSGHAASYLNVVNVYGEDGAGPDQLTTHGAERLRYDAAGRVIEDGTRRLTWDAKGRLARVETAETTEEYTYSFDDARAVKRTTGGGDAHVTRYIDGDAEERDGRIVRYMLLDGERVVRLDAQGNAPRAAWSHGRQLGGWALAGALALLGALATARRRAAPLRAAVAGFAVLILATCGGGSKRWAHDGTPIDAWPSAAVLYLGDHHGTVVAVANAGAELIQETAYHPYGSTRATRGTTADVFGFGANEVDATGLGNFHARPYRADCGMFLAVDPEGLVPESEDLITSAAQPAYAYALGNPTTASDRNGRCPNCCFGQSCARVEMTRAARNPFAYSEPVRKGYVFAVAVAIEVIPAGRVIKVVKAVYYVSQGNFRDATFELVPGGRLVKKSQKVVKAKKIVKAKKVAKAKKAQKVYKLSRNQAQKKLKASLGADPFKGKGQAHHVFDFVDHDNPLGKKLQNWGIDLNSADNGIWLPSKRVPGWKGAIHRGRSSQQYKEAVRRRLEKAGSKDEALEALGGIKDDLKSGKLKINDAK